MEAELQKITSRILAEAKEKEDAIVSQGTEEAKNIESEARARAKTVKEGIIKEAERKAEQERRRIIAEATINARKKTLNAREEIINRAFHIAEGELQKLVASPDYGDVLVKLIVEACIEIDGGEIAVLVREEDKTIVEKRLDNISKTLKGKGVDAKLSIADARINGPGAVVRTMKGGVEVSNLLETRLERMKPSLRLNAANILFG
ncbi:MAG: V-type ATP synthase subunit E family protein [Candidatus Hydrothermarchaeales archaeon]